MLMRYCKNIDGHIQNKNNLRFNKIPNHPSLLDR